MNNNILKRVFLFLLLLISFAHIQCRKGTTEGFCDISRSVYLAVNDREGVIVYSEKYNRYAVAFTLTTPNNIDTQVTGFLCEIPVGLRKIGLNVIVAGTLMNFNTEENMTPEIGGQQIYFLRVDRIERKP